MYDRQPLAGGVIHVARANNRRTLTLPPDFFANIALVFPKLVGFSPECGTKDIQSPAIVSKAAEASERG